MMNKKIYQFCLFAFGLGLLLAVFYSDATIQAATKEREKTNKVVRIGYIDYAGFFNKQEDGSMSGYGPELLEEISKYTGWKYEYVYDSFENLMKRLEKGDVDFICHAQNTPERRKKFLFSEYQTGSESDVCYVRNDDDRYYYNDFSAFSGMKVGLLKGSYQNEKFLRYAKRNGFSVKPVYFSQSSQAFEALNRKEIDSVAMGSLAAVQGYKIVCRFGADPFYFMTGKQNQKIIDDVNEALGEIFSSNPSFETSLMQKYYQGADSRTELLLTRQEQEFVNQKKEITVGLLDGRSPLSYNDNGQAKGIVVELMDMIAKRSGLKIKYTFLNPNETGKEFLDAGKGQMVAGVATSNLSKINPALIESNSMIDSSIVFVGNSGKKVDPKDEVTIAIQTKFMNQTAAIKEVCPKAKFYEASSWDDCVGAVKDGKADLMFQNIFLAREMLQKPQFEGLEIYQAFSFEEKIRVIVKPENEILNTIINKTIDILPEDSISQVVLRNTTGKSIPLSAQDLLYKYRKQLVILSIVLVALFAVVCYSYYIKQKNMKQEMIANKRLKESVEEAKRANQAKTDFMSQMSHDMRTPMNGILGLAGLMKEKNDIDEIHADLDQVIISGRLLLNLINDTLDMNKIEAGKLELHPIPCDSQHFHENVLVSAKMLAADHNVCLKIDIPKEKMEHWTPVIVDAPRMEQILLNILSNAIKFTPEGGTVSFGLRTLVMDADTITDEYIIEDTGIGMSKEFIPHLFEPFIQEGRSNDMSQVGSGLGMSIVKKLIDMMDGDIKVESKENVGTKVRIRVPLQRYKGEIEAKETLEQSDASLEGRCVLLCEDHPLNRQIAVQLLKKKGIRVEEAENGKIGVEMFQNSAINYYDAILMDIRMPVMTGIEATKAIRGLHRRDAKNIPIIAMTANAFMEDIKECRNAGMDEHIAKPINPALLFNTLQSYIGKEK